MISSFKRRVLLVSSLILLLAGCSTMRHQNSAAAGAAEMSAPTSEQRLGTEWGENIDSRVVDVEASRLSSSPTRIAAIYYSGGKLPSGASTFAVVPLADIEMRVQDERGNNMKIMTNSDGGYKMYAREGERYQLAFYNRSNSVTYEIVATVDGLDVLTGQPGSLERRGYLVRPRTTLLIEGFRKSDSAVAAFRFAKPDEAYAANSAAGDVNNVGVIGAAVFTIAPEELPDCQPQAFPASNSGRYAPPPCRKP